MIVSQCPPKVCVTNLEAKIGHLSKMGHQRPDAVAHTFKPVLRQQRQVDCPKLEASLVYIKSSSPARTTETLFQTETTNKGGLKRQGEDCALVSTPSRCGLDSG